MLTYGSLFSGIGGLDLGLDAAGLIPAYQCEIDPYCRAVLHKHWPSVPRHIDIRDLHPAYTDVICGGFPCQDISQVGAGRGLGGPKSGLWFDMLRCIDEAKPRFVIIENVARLIQRGLDVVVGGLADAGFAVEACRIKASDVGAQHRRERILIVAVAHDGSKRRDLGASSDSSMRNGPRGQGTPRDNAAGRSNVRITVASRYADTIAQPILVRVPHGLPGRLDWPVGRGVPQRQGEPARLLVAGTDKGEQWTSRIKALGNSVVPHIGYVAGTRVQNHARRAS